MDDLARTEYPAMLANLQPTQAVQTLNDRVKRINRINIEIADWLQERRRIEEQYVLGLRKLAQLKTPGPQSELGVFQGPWTRVNEAIEGIALSHHQFAERLERDVETPLRTFHQRQDSANMNTISTNLANLAKDLEEAQDKSDKLNRKGGKANTSKVDAALSKLESATQQWESQAPFVFESLQAFDESRINQLRDLLTQYQTHESDQAQRTLDNAAVTLSLVLEVSTEKEIQNFSQKVLSGRPRLAPRTGTRQSSIAPESAFPAALSRDTTNTSLAPPASSQPIPEDNASEHNSVPIEAKPESKLRRLGTMFGGRRRQSMHGGISSMSPQKSSSGFGRIGSSHGRGISPRGSSSNLHESRLTSLAEAPDLPSSAGRSDAPPSQGSQAHSGMNGVNLVDDGPVPASTWSASGPNGTQEHPDTPVAQPPPGSAPAPLSHQATAASAKDADGFSVPAPMNDPISEAQKEAAATGEEADQLFKLNIHNQPVAEEDPEAKEAAMSSVFNTLKMGPATRRSGTVRGRRDVRNTIYVPAPSTGDGPRDSPTNRSDGPAQMASALARPSALGALSSETSIAAAASDTQSVRSGTSLGGLAHARHPDLTDPGLSASIIETVSAVFEDGAITSTSIAGEIAFAYNVDEDNADKSHETIKINDFPNLERIGPNRIFVQNSSPDHPDQYSLDVSHLTKTAIAFSYRVFAEDPQAQHLAKNAPIVLKPAWKPQGDKLGLLLQYALNPACDFPTPVTLHNVVFVATYEGRASGAQTKPSGTHLKEKHLVYWRLGDVTLTAEFQKIVCRIVGAEGVEPHAGHVEARWEYSSPANETPGSGITFSRLVEGKGKGKEVSSDDPFADDGNIAQPEQSWVSVPLVRKLVSGKYEAK
ncbi:hypothetical protein NLU13_5866 [Sarocladium strictum]|uniref:MHD domain-containing protein n=1 Tax=Sarocladium strictum TaxID=5046 RepID=A0AA39L6W4_SARSR|nr:hypothetical protein NLU13_5866 [Sarocladium strictum]